MNAAGQVRHQFQGHLRMLLDSMSHAVEGMPAGADRLLTALDAYWESCYRQRPERLQTIQAARELAIEDQLTRLTGVMIRMLARELAACGLPDAKDVAQALGPEIRAIARAELLTNHRLPSQRRRLTDYIESRLVSSSGQQSTVAYA